MTSGRCLAAIRENAECLLPEQGKPYGYNDLRAGSLAATSELP